MFDAMADWMAVPLLHYEGGAPPRRIGLATLARALRRVQDRDGVEILISIQSDREWWCLAAQVLGEPALGRDPRFASNVARIANRPETDAIRRRDASAPTTSPRCRACWRKPRSPSRASTTSPSCAAPAPAAP